MRKKRLSVMLICLSLTLILTGCSHCGQITQTRNKYSRDFILGIRHEKTNRTYGEYTELAIKDFIRQNVTSKALKEYAKD